MNILPNIFIQYIAMCNDLTSLYNMMLVCKKYNTILQNLRVLTSVAANHMPYFKDCEATDIEYIKDCIAFYQHNKSRETLITDLRYKRYLGCNAIYETVIPHFLFNRVPLFKRSNKIIPIIISDWSILQALVIDNIDKLIQYIQISDASLKIHCEWNKPSVVKYEYNNQLLYIEDYHNQNWNSILSDFESNIIRPVSILTEYPEHSCAIHFKITPEGIVIYVDDEYIIYLDTISGKRIRSGVPPFEAISNILVKLFMFSCGKLR